MNEPPRYNSNMSSNEILLDLYLNYPQWYSLIIRLIEEEKERFIQDYDEEKYNS